MLLSADLAVGCEEPTPEGKEPTVLEKYIAGFGLIEAEWGRAYW